MKKIVSAIIAVLTVLSMFTLCFGASAAGGDSDPTYIVTEATRLIKAVGLSSGRAYCWSNSLGSGTTGGSMAFDAKFSTSAKMGTGNPAISINGAKEGADAIYKALVCYKINDGNGATLNSFVIAFRAGKDYDSSRPDGFTLYASDTPWDGAAKNNQYLSSPTTTEFDNIAVVSNLIKNEEWKLSKDGTYWFYEANFDAPITTKYVTLAFTEDNLKSAYIYISEFSVFAEKIQSSHFVEDTIVSHSATVTSNFDFNYYISIGDGSTLDKYQDFVAEYTFTDIFGNKNTYIIADPDSIKTVENRLTFTIKNIAAKNLADTILLKFSARDAEGQEYYVKDKISVKDYLVNILNGDNTDKEKAVAADALVYGAAAQKYFAKKDKDVDLTADKLMTADVSADLLALGTTDDVTTEGIPDTSFENDVATEKATIVAKSVVFNSALELKIYFTLDQSVNPELCMGGYSFDSDDEEVFGSVVEVDEGTSRFYCKTIGINLFSTDDTVHFSVNEDGVQLCKTLNYSVNTYIKNRLAASTDDNFKALLQATLNLAGSAKALYEANKPA